MNSAEGALHGTQGDGRARAATLARWLIVALLVVQPLAYWSSFAGDSVIHLIYAENAAAGAPYTFNPGELSSGVTSTGYMLLLVGLFHLLPAAEVPIAVKVVGLVAWWLSLFFVFGLAREVTGSRGWSWAVLAVAGSFPGSVYNAMVGMEAGLFIAWMTGWMWLAQRWCWFGVATAGAQGSAPAARPLALSRELGVGALLGFGFWLRPEAFVVAAVAFVVKLVAGFRRQPAGSAKRLLPGIAVAGGAALAVAGPELLYHWVHTGEWVPTSGRARTFIANVRSPRLAGIPVDPRFAKRLAYFAPLSIGLLLANVLLVLRPAALPARRMFVFFSITFWACFVLYTFVTGASHLARYIAFLVPGWVLVAFVAARWLFDHWDELAPAVLRPRRAVLFGLLAIGLAGLLGFEVLVRLGAIPLERSDRHSGSMLGHTVLAPSLRRERSDELLAELGHPRERPVVVALQEVQLRYELDDRFVVRSLDGRVDELLLDFATTDDVDHVGYFKARDVGYLLEAPLYVRDPHRWSIWSLNQLVEPGRSVVREGLRFTRLESGRGWRIDEVEDTPRRGPRSRDRDGGAL